VTSRRRAPRTRSCEAAGHRPTAPHRPGRPQNLLSRGCERPDGQSRDTRSGRATVVSADADVTPACRADASVRRTRDLALGPRPMQGLLRLSTRCLRSLESITSQRRTCPTYSARWSQTTLKNRELLEACDHARVRGRVQSASLSCSTPPRRRSARPCRTRHRRLSSADRPPGARIAAGRSRTRRDRPQPGTARGAARPGQARDEPPRNQGSSPARTRLVRPHRRQRTVALDPPREAGRGPRERPLRNRTGRR
jgi:hypothetical protein